MSLPRFSVCIPAGRDSAWFRSALNSAVGQSVADLEVIVSDESGGDLRDAVLALGDPRVRYLANTERLGFALNHQRVLDEARGDYVAILHDDDFWHADYLATAGQVLDEHPDLGLVITAATEIGADGSATGPRPCSLERGPQVDPLRLFMSDGFMMMIPSATVFRAKALAVNTRPWPELIAADMTAFIDVVDAGWGMYYVSTPLVSYRVHDGQIGVDEVLHREAVLRVWQQYSFADPAHERLRRRRVAADLVARAGAHLKQGARDRCREDALAARAVDPASASHRRRVLLALTRVPVLVPGATFVWSRLRRARSFLASARV